MSNAANASSHPFNARTLKSNLRSGVCWGAITSAILIAASPAVAQQTAQTSGPVLEEITVTARRIEENLQKVPVAVTAISAERISQLVINNVQDLNKLSASLTFDAGSASRATFRPTIRGYGTSATTASTVTYFAYVPLFDVATFDLESIQVLKGPQGTLFGETAVGGAVLFFPKKPSDATEGYVDLQAGTFEARQMEAAVGFSVVPEKLMLRLAGKYRHRNGFITGVFPDGSEVDLDDDNNTEWRISAVWNPTDTIENYTIYAGNHIRRNGNGVVLGYANPLFMPANRRTVVPAATAATAANFTAYAGYAPPAGQTWEQLLVAARARQIAAGFYTQYRSFDGSYQTEFNGFVNQTTWNVLDNLTAKNIFGVYWTRGKGVRAGANPPTDTDATDLPLIDTPPNTGPDGRPVWSPGWPTRTWTNEVQLLGQLFDDRLSWQAGYYHRSTGSRQWVSAQSSAIVIGAPPSAGAAATCASFTVAVPCITLSKSASLADGAYVQGTFKVLDTLNFTAGYRRTWEDARNQQTGGALITGPRNGVIVPLPQLAQEPPAGATVVTREVPTQTANTYSLTLDWQATDDILVYLTHRTGYKPGGLNNVSLTGTPYESFGPEKIKNYEVGVKAEWQVAGIKARTNMSLFRDNYSGIQRQTINPTAGFFQGYQANLADATITGFEIEPTFLVGDWLELSGAFAYTDPKWDNWVDLSTCAAQPYRPQCNGVATTTVITVDHSNGILTVGNAAPVRFAPDPYAGSSRYVWSIQPTIFLDRWLERRVSLGANIRHRSKFAPNGNNDIVNSTFAGYTDAQLTVPTLFGPSNTLIAPGYTLADVRLDWRDAFVPGLDLSAAVTNVANKAYVVGNGNALTFAGTVVYTVGEPRMFLMSARYSF